MVPLTNQNQTANLPKDKNLSVEFLVMSRMINNNQKTISSVCLHVKKLTFPTYSKRIQMPAFSVKSQQNVNVLKNQTKTKKKKGHNNSFHFSTCITKLLNMNVGLYNLGLGGFTFQYTR